MFGTGREIHFSTGTGRDRNPAHPCGRDDAEKDVQCVRSAVIDANEQIEAESDEIGCLEEELLMSAKEFSQIDDDSKVLAEAIKDNKEIEEEQCIWYAQSSCSSCILQENDFHSEHENIIACIHNTTTGDTKGDDETSSPTQQLNTGQP